MTEATEQKIEELNRQLAELKSKRDDLNSQAKRWAEQRDRIHEQVKTLQAEVKTLKGRRDESNVQVQVLKAAREKARAQRREKREQILKTRDKIKLLAPKKPSIRYEDLDREIKSLDWKIQTTSLSVKEEKALVDQVQTLEKQRVFYKQLQELKNILLELQAEAKALETQANLNHEKLSQFAEQSQGFHMQLLDTLIKVKTLRHDADEAHKKYVELRKEADNHHEQYVQIQQQIRSLKQEREKQEKERYTKQTQMLREEATRKAQEKMKRGEKLTWDEFKLLTDQEETAEH